MLNTPIKGRGSSSRLRNRFETLEYTPEPAAYEEVTPRRPTLYLRDVSKSIIAHNDSPDVRFDVSINPYRGCEHGCIYCYARPTHEFLGFSAGLDFESRIMIKENAPALLQDAMASPSWLPQAVGMSGVTDPYQPIERKLELTRGCLEVFNNFRNPVIIITKNRLVTRDIDILKEMAAHECVAVFISLTTLDLELNRILEPRTSSPAQRLDAIRTLSDAGIQVGTLIAPVIPALTDHEIESLISAAAQAGAKFAGYITLRLPLAVAPLFDEWLEQHFPDRKTKILNRMRSIRGGALYKSEFGKRMRGEGPYADQIVAMYEVACRRAGIFDAQPYLTTSAFRRPDLPGDQLALSL